MGRQSRVDICGSKCRGFGIPYCAHTAHARSIAQRDPTDAVDAEAIRSPIWREHHTAPDDEPTRLLGVCPGRGRRRHQDCRDRRRPEPDPQVPQGQRSDCVPQVCYAQACAARGEVGRGLHFNRRNRMRGTRRRVRYDFVDASLAVR